MAGLRFVLQRSLPMPRPASPLLAGLGIPDRGPPMPTSRHAASGGALAPRVCYCHRRSMFLRRKPTIEPCLPRPAKEPPSGPDWIHEIKHDGFRIMARRDAERVRLFTRHGTDFTDR